tara:strand:- start:279 stop:497 length:219 start_codon:yes stop_codon:yes gene_type:complete
MIDKNLNDKRDLLNDVLSYAEQYRKSFDEGGPVTPKPPINIDEYLELGIKISQLTAAQRESLEFMINKLKKK